MGGFLFLRACNGLAVDNGKFYIQRQHTDEDRIFSHFVGYSFLVFSFGFC
jgi:hypothetical protein